MRTRMGQQVSLSSQAYHAPRVSQASCASGFSRRFPSFQRSASFPSSRVPPTSKHTRIVCVRSPNHPSFPRFPRCPKFPERQELPEFPILYCLITIIQSVVCCFSPDSHINSPRSNVRTHTCMHTTRAYLPACTDTVSVQSAYSQHYSQH